MMITSREHSSSLVYGKSSYIENLASTELGCYDVAIVTRGWEERCINITKSASLTTEHTILICFEPVDSRGLSKNNESCIDRYFDGCSKSYIKIEGASSNPDEHFTRILSYVVDVRIAKHRPLSILVDLNTCPPYYTIGIIGKCLGTGIASTIDYFYSEVSYEEHHIIAKKKLNDTPVFTGGEWRLNPVPGIFNHPDFTARDDCIVSLGWEGEKTLRAVSRLDPNRLHVLFPDPGFRDGYSETTRQQNDELFRQYAIEDDHIIRAHAGDAIEAWISLEKAGIENPERNMYYVVCGTKPHALGVALRAITYKDRRTLLYPVPNSYNISLSFSTGKHWLYSCNDLAIL